MENQLKAIERSSGRLEKKTEKIEDTQDVSVLKNTKVYPSKY